MTERQHRMLEEYGLAAVQPTDGAKSCWGQHDLIWDRILRLERASAFGEGHFFFLFRYTST